MQALGRLIHPTGGGVLPGGRLLPALLDCISAGSHHLSLQPAPRCTSTDSTPSVPSCSYEQMSHHQVPSSRPHAPFWSLPFTLQHAQFSTTRASSRDLNQAAAQPPSDAPASISPLQAALPVVTPAPKRAPQAAMKEATCNYRNVPGGWKKYNLVLDVVRRMQVDDALGQCDLLKKRTAQVVKKALINAVSNAVYQKGMDRDNLVVDEIYVTKGQYRKKLMVMGRGFSGRILSKYCHLKVVLREVPERVRHRTVYVKPIMERHRKRLSSPALAS